MPVSVAGLAVKGALYFIAQRKPGTSIGETWEFPGGKVEPGEDHVTALKREYLEEFGVDINVRGNRCRSSFSNGGKKYELYAYDIELLGSPTPKEHQKIGWKKLPEIKALNLADSDRDILDILLDEAAG